MINNRNKLSKFTLVVGLLWFVSLFGAKQVLALTIYDLQPKVESASITAKSAVVLDQVSGQVLYEVSSDTLRVPASLVKLVTALVVLDTNPNWEKTCYIEDQDRVGGSSVTSYGQGKVGYKMGDMFRAMLIPSGNDAAESIARCTGLSRIEFLARMQAKAQQQGAWTASFADVSGLSSQNRVSALDVARLANAAFSTEYVRNVTRTQSYKLCSTSGSCKYIKNTNELLADSELTTIAGKTGTLDGAINFAGSFLDTRGHYFIVVVLGAETKEERFAEAKELVQFASERSWWQDLFAAK